MTSRQLRDKLDALWTTFWTGGITNPLTVIEQITYLMFLRLLDMGEENRERIARRTGKGAGKSIFPQTEEGQALRWNRIVNMAEPAMHKHMRDNVFLFLRELGTGQGKGVAKYLRDAQYLIPTGTLLNSAMTTLSGLPLDEGDTKGDLYEYLLSKLTTAGINGQFRTPKHIRRTMVELMQPVSTDTISDPACGTGGFLVSAMEYLLRTNTSPDARLERSDLDLLGDVREEDRYTYPGDLLGEQWEHVRNGMFHGFDFDATMLRIAAMNLLLHQVDGDAIHYQDTLATSFKDIYPQFAFEGFDLILANPPFKGSLDENSTAAELTKQVKSKKTELLFVVRILQMLKLGGRAAVIVPDGVLFGSSRAHVDTRKLLLDENQLDGVISLPSGVFKPYAGVSTAILLFTKGGKTDDVFFFDVQADGYSLDDKRNPIEANDLPEMLERWQKRDPQKDTNKTGKAFFVSADEIRRHKYDLSLNRYKEQVHEAVEYDPPQVILERMEKLEEEIAADLQELRGMLG